MADWNSWVVTTDERIKHDAQFQFLKPTNGYITGEQVKLFFLKSGLPPTVLGQIWSLADMDADGKLDKKEFSIAMFLIKKKLEGMQLPPTLPTGLKNDPQPVFIPSSSPSLSRSSVLDTPVGLPSSKPSLNGLAPSVSPVPTDSNVSSDLNEPHNWTIGPNSRPKYRLLFNQHDRAKRGFITGVEARGVFLQSGLSQQILAHIWWVLFVFVTIQPFPDDRSLADLDKDGNLNCDEFCIAAFLIDKALAGVQLPATLPSGLYPSQLRAGRQTPSSLQPTQPASEDEGKAPALSFEDKRRENFLQGQVELDRRKQELAEQLRQEEEARLEKERQEQERLEKLRLEKEREKALETERQAERLRELEAQREVRRRQAVEARTKAWRAAEAQRQLEAEKQRVEALQKEKCQASALLEQAIAHRASLIESASSQEQRKRELETRLFVASAEVDAHKSAINDMRGKRDTYERDIRELTEQVEAAKAELSRWQREREQLSLRVSTGVDTNPTAEQCKTLRASSDLRRASIQRLESQLAELDEGMTRQGEQLASRRNTVTELEKRSCQLDVEVARLRQKLEGQFRSYLTLKNPGNVEKLFDGLGSLETGDQTEQYEVMFDFTARHPDELSLSTGALVQIVSEPPFPVAAGWLYGESNGMKGLFPESYVRKRVTGKIDPFDPFGVHKATTNSIQKAVPSSAFTDFALSKQTTTPEENKKAKSDPPTSSEPLFSCIALFPFESTVPGDLNLAVNDVVHVYAIRDEWWEGECEQTKLSGLFPANYTKKLTPEELSAVKTLSSASPPLKSTEQVVLPNPTPPINTTIATTMSSQSDTELTVSASKSGSPAPGSGQASPSSHITITTKPEFARVIAPYTATAVGQLSLQPGQVVQLRKRSAKGWWEGELQQRGRVRQFGWFPADYVKVISASSLNGSQAVPGPLKTAARSTTDSCSSITTTVSTSEAPTGTTLTHTTTSPKMPTTEPPIPAISTVPSQSAQPTQPTQTAIGNRSVEMMQAIFSYRAAHADELTFEEGSVITVLGRDEPEWWRGRLQSSGAEGLFPVNYVRPYTQPVPGAPSKQPVPHGPTTTVSAFVSTANTKHATESCTVESTAKLDGSREHKRNLAIFELLQTEEIYASDLLKLQTDFCEPIRRVGVLTEDELTKIFSNFVELHQLSLEFHRALQQQMDVAGSPEVNNSPIPIGKVFLQQLPKFSAFRHYCKHQESAIQTLQHLLIVVPQLKMVLLQCEHGNLPLSSYLLKPIQRLTRYGLFLQRILADTAPFHPDYESTLQANERLTRVLSSINTTVGCYTRKNHIRWLQNHLLGESVSLNWLLAPHRPKMLHYGTLYKPKSNRELVAFLFDSHLLLAVPNPPLVGRSFEFPSVFFGSNVTLKVYRQPIALGEVVVSAGTSISNVQVDKLFRSLSVLSPTESDPTDLHGRLRSSQSSLDVASPGTHLVRAPSFLTPLQPVFSLFSRNNPNEPLIRLKTRAVKERFVLVTHYLITSMYCSHSAVDLSFGHSHKKPSFLHNLLSLSCFFRDQWISHIWKAIQKCPRHSSFPTPSQSPAAFDALFEIAVDDQARQTFRYSQDQQLSTTTVPVRIRFVCPGDSFLNIWAYDISTQAELGRQKVPLARLLDSARSTADQRATKHIITMSNSTIGLQIELQLERTTDLWVVTELNLAPDVGDEYPVLFQIMLWTSVALILVIWGVSWGIWNMDPGHDGIIYRGTAVRPKRD
ncbi:SH3 domain protein [Opisthorchis viverrini]|uniref:SH3 domain protein n=1 Tax=Opisthorchis viverrini TaxID=6198 RepID=A0A1S8XAR8_OPIVI|nr:SH3 domain protein [Opisthorchis viverrini]